MIRTRSQNGRRSRAKGAQWEREVARVLAAIWPGAERNIAQSRTAAREGCDVEGTPYWVECKCGAGVDLRAAWKQAEGDRDADLRPIVLVVKEDRRRPYVVCEASVNGVAVLARVYFSEWVCAHLASTAALAMPASAGSSGGESGTTRAHVRSGGA